MLKKLLGADKVAAIYKLFGYRVVVVTVRGEEQVCTVSITRDFLQHVEVRVGDRLEPMVLNSHARYRYRWL